MRRILIGVTLAAIGLGAMLLWSRPAPELDVAARRDELSRQARPLSDAEVRKIIDHLMIDVAPFGPDLDPGIAFMSCGITEQEPTGNGRFLLTEECTWRSGRVERRRIPGVRVEDGTSYGWMIHPEDDA